MTAFARRLAKLEAANAPPPQRFPCVIHVRVGETRDEAIARYVGVYGPIPKLQRERGFLVVPERPTTPEAIAECERISAIRQRKLLAFARQRPEPKQEPEHV